MKRKLSLGVLFLLAVCLVGLGIARQRGRSHAELSGQAFVEGDATGLANTVVTSHLEQEIVPGKSILWCNTFQLAWNELCDITGGPVKMRWGPRMVKILNKRTASKKDLDEASYVAMAGMIEDGTEAEIRRELDRKFHGLADPELLDSAPPADGGVLIYAYLFKSMPFRWAFHRSAGSLPFDGQMVDSFGIWQYLSDEKKIADQVSVLDYQENDDLIVELKTKQEEDRLILAKITPGRTLAETIETVERRVADGKPTGMPEGGDLSVPVLDFKILRDYHELCGHAIQTTNGELQGEPMVLARQIIRFRLDERGAVLKSEAIGGFGGVQRNLVFDKPFLIMLKRRDAENPYFAMWVGNAELMIARQPPELQKGEGLF